MSEKLKTESTTSLISKDSSVEAQVTPASQTQNGSSVPSTDNGDTVVKVAVPTNFQDFSQKSREHGWATPTPTKPTMGQ
ncbi:hypothetical protein E1B28_012834 [Marasmius oreades]|uniref:Uncharacterized protein n=1 Tax=Marasmius oreades TaxID=181124 RepID=A0A9P7RSL3_9AGAR|nr:uncharacterized protein E1B28_012834 [Marasmius oreades]KAG7088887.1 hypothetical protein E1B28_012834 [Marasmius oreades]